MSFSYPINGTSATVLFSGARLAFLTLIRYNVNGYATKLYYANNVNAPRVKSSWNKFGGNYTTLKKAIAKGVQRSGIKIGSADVDNQNTSDTVNTNEWSAIIAAAVQIIAFFAELFKIGEKAQESNAYPPPTQQNANIGLWFGALIVGGLIYTKFNSNT